MRTLTCYTDPIKPGVMELPPFVLGDDTNWTLKFFDGTNYWIPSDVSMRVGYVNGLVPGSYPSAFKWTDRMNNQHVASFSISAGCAPGGLTWDEAPLNVQGSNGAWLLRGRTPPQSSLRKLYLTEVGGSYTPLGISAGCTVQVTFYGGMGALTTYNTTTPTGVLFCTLLNMGSGYTWANVVFSGGGGGGGAAAQATVAGGQVVAISMVSPGQGYTSTPTVTIVGDGTAASASCTLAAQTNTVLNTVAPAVANATVGAGGFLTSLNLLSGGAGYTSLPTLTIAGNVGAQGEAAGIETNGVCFLRNPSSIAVQNAVAAVPWSRGRQTLNAVKVYDDSLLIIRPSLIANASLSQSGSDPWSGTLNPVTDFVHAVLAFRRSCVMDLQIFGSGRLLYQGAFAVMSTIPTY
jgi:hypothetical protein